MKRTKPYPNLNVPRQSKDLPATQGMMRLVRNEFKSDVRELRSEMKAEFKQMDAKVERVLEAVHHVAAEVARVGILVEEQNSRNRIVLEGLTGLDQRDDRIEARVDEVEKIVRSIARSSSRT